MLLVCFNLVMYAYIYLVIGIVNRRPAQLEMAEVLFSSMEERKHDILDFGFRIFQQTTNNFVHKAANEHEKKCSQVSVSVRKEKKIHVIVVAVQKQVL